MFNRIGLFFNTDKYLYTGIIEMTTEFFRKFADLITEAEVPVVNPAVKKAAIKIERGVNRISGIGNDDGYEWLAGWNTPIGVAYNAYWETDASDDTDFSDYLIQTVDHNTILEYGADVASWVNDAKFDIDF